MGDRLRRRCAASCVTSSKTRRRRILQRWPRSCAVLRRGAVIPRPKCCSARGATSDEDTCRTGRRSNRLSLSRLRLSDDEPRVLTPICAGPGRLALAGPGQSPGLASSTPASAPSRSPPAAAAAGTARCGCPRRPRRLPACPRRRPARRLRRLPARGRAASPPS